MHFFDRFGIRYLISIVLLKIDKLSDQKRNFSQNVAENFPIFTKVFRDTPKMQQLSGAFTELSRSFQGSVPVPPESAFGQ